MAVYREGYDLVKTIGANTKRVFNDAFDEGAPVTKDDELWKLTKYAIRAYGIPESRSEDECGIYITIELMDEWAFSDGRKSEEEAIEQFRIFYCPIKRWKGEPYLNQAFRGANGYLSVTRIAKPGEFTIPTRK